MLITVFYPRRGRGNHPGGGTPRIITSFPTTHALRIPRIAALLGLLLMLSSASVRAQSSYTWTGGGGDSNFGTGANWSGGSAPGSLQGYLNFAGSTDTTPYNNYNAYSYGFQIYFNSGAASFTLDGNAINFYTYNGASDSNGSNPGIENDSSSTQTINLQVDMESGGATFFVNALSGNINLGQSSGNAFAYFADNGSSTLALNASSGKTITVNGSINNGGSAPTVNISGPGTVIYAVATTYSGSTLINSGVLDVDSSSALGGDGNISFGGGTLQYGSNSGDIDYSPYIFNSASAISIDVNGQSVMYASSLAVSNTGGLTLNDTSGGGGGLLTLGASNSYSGPTTVTNGTLVANVNGALGNTSSIAVNGGTLLLNAGSAANTTPNVTLNGGKLALSASSGITESLGSLTLSSNSTLDMGTTNGSNILFSGLTGYTMGALLTVENWSSSDTLAFSSSTNLSNLTTFAANDVQFNGYGVGANVEVIPMGNTFAGDYELVAIPEPKTVVAGLLLLLLIGMKEWRRAWELVSGKK